MRALLLVTALAGCSTDLGPPTGELARYRVDREDVDVATSGFDLDGDDTIENTPGYSMHELSERGLAPSRDQQTLFRSGALGMLVDLKQPRDSGEALGVGIYPEGAASPPLVITEDTEPPLVLPLGTVTVDIPFYEQAVELDLVHARARITGDDDRVAATIGGGVRPADIRTKLVPLLASTLEEVVARDCTARDEARTCGCPALGDDDYSGLYWIQLFDTEPFDCAISETELADNPLIKSLINPDLNIDGEQLVSFAVGISGARE